jgi:REP element-mobilizing transposase RayT
MAFFQNSVLNKHLNGQDEKTVKAAYQKFTAYFHNPAIQQNIRDAKEEQFQEGFLRELFVDILGYTLNPQPDYNLTTELKNEKGAKKADGAILQGGKALGVIELKGTDTKDLDKINVQAFNYKNNQTGCVYVITSNFEKLRFFIHHSVEHLEFNLFTLTETEFQLLWLCLSADNLFNGVPLKVKEESLIKDEQITKQLYKDYASFRNDLWQNMVKNNAQFDKLLLFKETQKLLDRFLFIFFAEDSGLLPPNSISRIVERFEILKREDAYKPLYEIFQQYFGYINKGRKGQKAIDDIFAYNGGLFLPDEVLDNIKLDDDILHTHVMKLTNYDFQSEVDVNILGHIFENSLNEIENITAELEGQEVDKSKTKRKKDGVFYTPKYITKYIVDNTVGKLCEEKKDELGIGKIVPDKTFVTSEKQPKLSQKGKDYSEKLNTYRKWLLDIKICDPACGSGAFLNETLDFLINEHLLLEENVLELQKQLTGGGKQISSGLQDISNEILEKNIFGVDINNESVEIAKLSLWLRTAQRGRKLTTLNNNIKCGNSLIDDPSVAREKAFNWQKEFPSVFVEKDKKAFHITTATHDSRTSQRMIDYKVRELRDNGLRPKAEPIWLEPEDEILITNILSEIIKEDELNVMAYNICGDHLHLLLVCEEEEVSKIVGKIKAITSKEYNIARGITIREQDSISTRGNTYTSTTRGDTYTSTTRDTYTSTTKHLYINNKGTCPLVERGKENL